MLCKCVKLLITHKTIDNSDCSVDTNVPDHKKWKEIPGSCEKQDVDKEVN